MKKTTIHITCSNFWCKLREIKNNWWINHAAKTQFYADTSSYSTSSLQNIEFQYASLHTRFISSYQLQSPLYSVDGQTLFTDKTFILKLLVMKTITALLTHCLRFSDASYPTLNNKKVFFESSQFDFDNLGK